jgi:predicted MFS family arabinose efflux permease
MNAGANHDDSIVELIRGILGDLHTLVCDQLALARAQVQEQGRRARVAAVCFGVAAAALAVGGVFLLIALATALSDLLDWPVWAGFLAVSLVLSIIGVVMLLAGRRNVKRLRAMPQETLAALKENSEWIASHLTSDRR